MIFYFRWWTGPWQLCPVTCGDVVMRSRTVLCISNVSNGLQIALPDSECEDVLRPHHKEPCLNIPSCLSSVNFINDDFINNNNTDNIKSTDGYYLIKNKSNRNNKKLNFKITGFEQNSKTNWIILPWSQCSVTCGLGFKKRTVYCPRHRYCHHKSKPIEVKQCFKKC